LGLIDHMRWEARVCGIRVNAVYVHVRACVFVYECCVRVFAQANIWSYGDAYDDEDEEKSAKAAGAAGGAWGKRR
jgi:hypothetical protein